MWRVLTLLCLFLVSPAFAQTGSAKTTSVLNTEINANFPDNTLNIITPMVARQTFLDMVASFGSSQSANTWSVAQTFNASPFSAIFQTEAVFNGGMVINQNTLGSAITQASGASLIQGFNFVQNASGSISLPPSTFNLANVNDTENSGANFINGWSYVYNYGGTGANGGRQAFQAILNILGAVGTGNPNWSVFNAQANGIVNTGGTSGSPAGYLSALNPSVVLSTGATFYREIAGSEYDMAIQTGGSASYLAGEKIVQYASHVVHASVLEGAFVVTNQSGAIGWNNVFFIGAYNGGVNPLATAGNILATSAITTTGNGIDLSNVTFSAGAAYKWAGGSLGAASHGAAIGYVCYDASNNYFGQTGVC